MGCSSYENIKTIEDKNDKNKRKPDFFEVYKSIKNIILRYKDKKDSSVSFKAFLISTKSIPNFLKLIQQSEVLEHVLSHKDKNDTDSYETKLKELLKNYDLEENIKIYYDYDDLLEIKKKEEDNEFIIVDHFFIENMIGNLNDNKNKEIIVDIENDEEKWRKIKFGSKFLGFKEKKVGFY